VISPETKPALNESITKDGQQTTQNWTSSRAMKKHLLIVATYWLGGFTALMLTFYLIISLR
jgi:hypothetical protein